MSETHLNSSARRTNGLSLESEPRSLSVVPKVFSMDVVSHFSRSFTTPLRHTDTFFLLPFVFVFLASFFRFVRALFLSGYQAIPPHAAVSSFMRPTLSFLTSNQFIVPTRAPADCGSRSRMSPFQHFRLSIVFILWLLSPYTDHLMFLVFRGQTAKERTGCGVAGGTNSSSYLKELVLLALSITEESPVLLAFFSYVFFFSHSPC